MKIIFSILFRHVKLINNANVNKQQQNTEYNVKHIMEKIGTLKPFDSKLIKISLGSSSCIISSV